MTLLQMAAQVTEGEANSIKSVTQPIETVTPNEDGDR